VKRRIAIIAVGVIGMFTAPATITAASAAPAPVGGASARASGACLGGILGLGLCLPALF
jgi:hypothetical protein